MQFTTALLGLLASTASARIIGIAVPTTIRTGEGFNIRLLSEGYIQSVYDVAAVVSGVSGGRTTPTTVFGSYYLGPEQSNQGNSYIPKWVDVPASQAKGPGIIDATVFSLFGVGGGNPILQRFNVSTTFAEETSTTYVSSIGR